MPAAVVTRTPSQSSPRGSPRPTPADPPPADPALAELAAAWPTLPPATRAAILAVARSAVPAAE